MTNQQIISLLPSGAQTRIAEQVGVSRQAVSKALNGLLKGAKAERIVREAKQQAEAAQRGREAFKLRDKIARMTDDELLKRVAIRG